MTVEKDYEYRDMLATTWDLLRGDTSGWSDRFFYRGVIEEYGQPVLDVGCSTGRLLLDYLQQGIDIDGVDLSPEMLALCRQKAQTLGLHPTLHQQSMAALDLPRRYRTILVSSSSFQLLLEPGEAEEAMRRFYNHLEPGGALVMPFMVIWQEGEPLDTGWSSREKVRPEDGALIRRWSRAVFEPDRQLEHTQDRYEVIQEGEVIQTEEHQRSPATRWYTQEQAVRLYEEAGFTNIRLYRKFTREPASPQDTLFSVLGERLR